MGRKIALVSIFLLSIIVVGCGKNANINTDTVSSLVDSLEQERSRVSPFSGIIRENHTIQLDSRISNIPLKFQSSMVRITNDLYRKSRFDFAGSFTDPEFFDTIQLSGNLFMTEDNGDVFIKTDELDINLGTGNAEGVLIDLIVDGVKGKRMALDDDNKSSIRSLPNIVGILSLGSRIADGLSSGSTLTVQNNRIMINTLPSIIDLLYSSLGYTESSYIPSYTIDFLHETRPEILIYANDENMNRDITITIYSEHIVINMIDEELSVFTYTWNRISESEAMISFNFEENGRSSLTGSLTVNNLSSENVFALRYEGILSVGYPRAEDPNNILDINVSGMYSLRESDDVQKPLPETYLLFDQFFGDDYNLDYILGQ